jgi:hypothetical protein
MGWGYITFNYTETVQSCCNKEAFAENVKGVHCQAMKVPFTGSWQFSAT